jgi:hypothetical protein
MAQLKSMIAWLFAGHQKTSTQQMAAEPQDFHAKFQNAFQRGDFAQMIEKAEVDYANGKALDTLY